MRLLDLFCGAGGCSVGYARAGFDVVGVDNRPQPDYPFEFHQADALAFPLYGFDAVHASPPCQSRSKAQKIQKRDHPRLIAPTRVRLRATGLPYVIENVPPGVEDDDPLLDPYELCGAMFGLGTYRDRHFETNFPLTVPPHPEHVVKTTKMGRRPRAGEYMHVVGNFSGVAEAKRAMGIDWMNRDELAQAIPPAYTEFVGAQLLAHLEGVAA